MLNNRAQSTASNAIACSEVHELMGGSMQHQERRNRKSHKVEIETPGDNRISGASLGNSYVNERGVRATAAVARLTNTCREPIPVAKRNDACCHSSTSIIARSMMTCPSCVCSSKDLLPLEFTEILKALQTLLSSLLQAFTDQGIYRYFVPAYLYNPNDIHHIFYSALSVPINRLTLEQPVLEPAHNPPPSSLSSATASRTSHPFSSNQSWTSLLARLLPAQTSFAQAYLCIQDCPGSERWRSVCSHC
jgi:hypothetical protein